MSTEDRVPVYETVCTKTEEKLVGFREPTDDEFAALEEYSSGVPEIVGPVFDREAYLPQGPIPSVLIAPPVDVVKPVPIPMSAQLFALVIIAVFLFGLARKGCKP